MKTTKLIFLGILLPVLLISCGPHIVTNFVKTYPVIISSDSVKIYDQYDSIFVSADTIGDIVVRDAGNSADCQYATLLNLAKGETAKAGGNALALYEDFLLTERESKCHKIAGIALRITNSDSFTALSDFSVVQEKEQIIENVLKKRRAPKNTLSANFGGGWIISRITLERGSYRNVPGKDWRVEFEHLYDIGVGYGIQYSGYYTNFFYDYEMRLTYIAPSLIYRARINHWLFKLGVGIGYFGCVEINNYRSIRTSGVAVNLDCGVEYMLSNHLGLGVSASLIKGFLPTVDWDPFSKDHEYPGIVRMNILAGIHYYF